MTHVHKICPNSTSWSGRRAVSSADQSRHRGHRHIDHPDQPVLWVDVTLSNVQADHVAIRILRPARRSQNRLYQRCYLPYSGPGTYRCGIDLNTAQRLAGTWVARAFLDHVEVARKRFVVE